MRCLFCKQDSSNTRSVEHIIPESMGNKKLILPLGYVCDKCNNFFARKVEKPFMDIDNIKLWRAYESLLNKKGRAAVFDASFNSERVSISFDDKEPFCFRIMSSKDFDNIVKNGNGKLSIPIFTNETKIENSITISRMIAKMALEFWAFKLKDISNSLDEIIDDDNYDLIRNHARLGTPTNWPCSIRRVYDMEKSEILKGKKVQKVYECDFLLIKTGEIDDVILAIVYFVVIIRGIEFAINLREPEIDTYYEWLKEHDDLSPLYYNNKG
ncbi:MAG: HNH endonuclease [Treponema sp.]|nr:HNH endonuclease [Treponema sp.]